MSDAVRQTLAKIVAQYGREIADDPRRCEGLLRDLCGDWRREIHILVTAVKEKVVSELLSGGDIPPEALMGRGVKRLHEHTGIAEDAARWGVESWALALGVVAPERLSLLSRQTEPAGTTNPHIKGWFYSHNGGPRQGPFSAADLRRMAAAGQLLRSDHLWKEGMPAWVAASSVKNLFPEAALSSPTHVQTTPLASTPAHVPPTRQQPPAPAPATNPVPATKEDKLEDGLGIGCVCFLVLFLAATVVAWCSGRSWAGIFGVEAGAVLGVAVLTILVAPRHKDSVSGPTAFWAGLLGGARLVRSSVVTGNGTGCGRSSSPWQGSWSLSSDYLCWRRCWGKRSPKFPSGDNRQVWKGFGDR